MTAKELLIHQTRVRLADFIETVRKFPQGKLDWKPAPGARTALDQIQEVATILDFGSMDYKARKMDFKMEEFGAYVESRAKITELDELIRRLEASCEKAIKDIESVPDEELLMPFEMPWPVDFKVVDVLGYQQWNMGYHAAQITYIESLLEKPE
ncbi:hypothetical protein BH11ARM2_BH11ARM2_11960 [soil metagenome]